LKPDGRLLLPLEIKGGIQKSIAFDKRDDHLESISIKDCGFMTLRGTFAKPQESFSLVYLGSEPGLCISAEDGVKIKDDAVYDLLSGPSEDQPIGVNANPGEVVFGGLSLWLSLREPGFCSLSAEGQSAKRGIVPCFFAYQGGAEGCGTIGLLGDDGLCVFVRPPGLDSSSEQPDRSQAFELFVRSYRPGTEIARRLIEQTKAWDAAGRPSSNGLRIRAYLDNTDYIPSTHEFVVRKRCTQLILDWK
jgi:protein-L-isoaspartate(D-aspartate) O-methyltransferase